MISAEIVADSVSPQGRRLTTVKCVYPWFIHGEVMTHRVFSRNASSNRAVPTAKLLAEVRDPALRAVPSFSVVNAPGMQGGRPTTKEESCAMELTWAQAAKDAAERAEVLTFLGAAKQDVNRLLMPFTHARVLISSTEWDNFFGLRLHRDAQPEVRRLAQAIWEARVKSEPAKLTPGQWHLPYIQHEEVFFSTDELSATDVRLRCSVARCARVSYESFETGRRSTVEEDLKLYDRLVGSQPMHASPAEHQATPDALTDLYDRYGVPVWEHPHEHGNFKGWRQWRKMLHGEDKAPLPEGY